MYLQNITIKFLTIIFYEVDGKEEKHVCTSTPELIDFLNWINKKNYIIIDVKYEGRI